MRQKNERRLIVLLFLALVMILASCQNRTVSTQADASGKEADEKETAGQEKVLTIGTPTDMPTFDIHNHNTAIGESIHVNMFDYLVRRDNDGNLHNDLAENYERKDDTTWHFTLKQGVKFHNGDPFTANDVKFTLERVSRDDTLLEYERFKSIKEVNVIDDYNLDIVTNGPDPILLYRLAKIGAGMLPKNYIEKEGWDVFLKNPVGTGPYQFVEWIKDDRVVLEKFPDYFEGDVSEWDRVVFRAIPENTTRVGELLTGGIDMAVNVPPADWDRINNHKGTTVLESNSTEVMHLMAKIAPGLPTADVRVRQAIDYAINNKAIADNLLKGKVTPTRTQITPGVQGLDESLYNSYRYDPEKAKQLLKEAGYENGLELTLQVPQGRFLLDTDVAQMVAGMLTQVGINTKVEILENSRYVEIRKSAKSTELMLSQAGNDVFDVSEPLNTFQPTGMAGKFGYRNPNLEQLLKQALVNLDAESRKNQYAQAQQILAEELPYIYLHHLKYFVGINDKIDFQPRVDRMFYVRDIKEKK